MVRLKRRYVLGEIVFPNAYSNGRVTASKIFIALKNAIIETHGDLGFASLVMSVNVKYANPDTNIVIIRGDRKHFDILSSSLVFISQIDKYPAFINTIHVAGSIRSCLKFIIKYHKQNLPRLYPLCTSQEQKGEVLQSIMDACEEIRVEGMRQTLLKQEVGPSALDVLTSSEQLA